MTIPLWERRCSRHSCRRRRDVNICDEVNPNRPLYGYTSDPTMFDSDGDGEDDGYEFVNKQDPLSALPRRRSSGSSRCRTSRPTG